MIPLLVLAAVPATVRHDLQTLHDRMARQYVTKAYDDMVALANARFAPEFWYRKQFGPPMDLLSISTMRDDEMRNLRRGRGDGPLRWRTRLDGWAQNGGTLTVVAHHDVVGEAWTPKGRIPVKGATEVRETWVRRDGEWKALTWDETWVRWTMLGETHERQKA